MYSCESVYGAEDPNMEAKAKRMIASNKIHFCYAEGQHCHDTCITPSLQLNHHPTTGKLGKIEALFKCKIRQVPPCLIVALTYLVPQWACFFAAGHCSTSLAHGEVPPSVVDIRCACFAVKHNHLGR